MLFIVWRVFSVSFSCN